MQVTTEMLQPLVDTITANAGIILGVGITIFGIFASIKSIPKLINHFI